MQSTDNPSQQEQTLHAKLKPKLIKILNGNLTEELNLLYLRLNNQSDPKLFLNIKNAIDPKNSIAHSSIIIANSIF